MADAKRAKKTLSCERCGGIAKARHTCRTCKRLCCENCVTHHGDRYGGETWWGCYDEGSCVDRDKQPEAYFPKTPITPRAQLEAVFGPFTPAQVRRYNKSVKAQAQGCLLCDELDLAHPTADGHDVCRELDMGRRP